MVRHLRIPETPAGVDEMLSALRALNPTSHRFSRKQVPVAIEDSGRLIVAELRRRQQPVIHIPPAVASRHRGRTAVATSKSDRTDAALLANIIRRDPGRFRLLPDNSDSAAAVTVLARAQKDAAIRAAEMAVRLQAHLRLYFPAAVQAWAGMEHGLRRGEARAVLALAATPRAAAALSKPRLYDALAAGGRTRLLDDHAARLRDLFGTPQLRHRPLTEEAMGIRTLSLLSELDNACQVNERLEVLALDAFSRHPHSAVYRTFPGLKSVLGARVFAEIGDDPDRFTNARALRSYAGTAPLTWASGDTQVVTHRRVANRRLKVAVHSWAFTSLNRSPGCRALYDRRREHGDRYAAALRHVGGRLLAGLHHCIQTGTVFSETAMFPHATTPTQ